MADLDTEIRRAEEAERIMNEPLVKEALETIEQTLHQSLLRVDLKDLETQRTIVGNIQILHGFKRILQSAIETGKMARIQKETLVDRVFRKVKG